MKRKIKLEEVALLEDIIVDSLSVWGYSSEELRGLKKRLEISSKLLKRSVTYVVDLNLLGLYSPPLAA